MKYNKGISLIVLIITIIVVVIIVGTVILNLSDTNIIDDASEAVFLSDLGNFKVELDLYQTQKYTETKGNYDISKLNADSITATYDGNILEGITMYDIIPSMENKSNYIDFKIIDGKITYLGEEEYIKTMLDQNQYALYNNKPEAVITMTPLSDITTDTIIDWDYSSSTDPDGDSIIDYEWDNKLSNYDIGSQTVGLRVKDSKGIWSDWEYVNFDVVSGAFTPTQVSEEYVLTTTDVEQYFDFKIDSDGNVNYFWYTNGRVYRKVLDMNGNEVKAKQTLISSGICEMNYSVTLKSFDVELDNDDNIYIIYQKNSLSTYISKFDKNGQRIGNETLVYTKYSSNYTPAYHFALSIYNDEIYFSVNDQGGDGGWGDKIYLVKLDTDLNQIGGRLYFKDTSSSSLYEGQLIVTENKVYLSYLGFSSTSGQFPSVVRVYDKNLNFLKHISLSDQARRYIGDIELDKNDILWHVDNMAWNENYDIHSYTIDEDQGVISNTLEVFIGKISGFVRMERLSDGKLMIVYSHNGKMVYKLLY